MSAPEPKADGLRRYGRWAGNNAGNLENTYRCVEAIFDRYSPGGHQCNRKRGHGPDGLYCKQHDPIAVKVRRDKEREVYECKMARQRLAWERPEEFKKALKAIAAGHNDPRSLAVEVLAKFEGVS